MRAKILLSVLFLLTPYLLMAQKDTTQKDTTQKESKLSKLSLEQLMNIEISTPSKKPEKVREAPATVYVITQEDIKNRGYWYLKDVLRDLPGMETIENYFAEQGTLVPVRGVVGNNKIIVLVNGRRVNPPGGEQMMFRSDFNILQAKQIEVMYGPSSVLYGQDAISAVINVITESPQEKIKTDVIARGGMINDKDMAIAISSKLTDESHPYVGLTASFSHTNSNLTNLAEKYPTWWNNTYGSISEKLKIRNTPYRFDRGFNGFLKLENENSSIQFWHRESSRSSGEGGLAPSILYTNEALWHDRTTVVSGNNQFAVSDKVKLNSSISYSRYEIARDSRYVFPLNDSTVFLNDYKYGIGTGLRIEEQFDYKISEKISLTAGLLAAYYDITPKASIPGGADLNKDLSSQGGSIVYYTKKGDSSSRVELRRVTTIRYQNYGGYTEGRFQVSEKLKAIIGLRVDTDTRFPKPQINPRFALIYNASEHFNIKYIFNKGYLAPSLYFSHNVFVNNIHVNTFNENLKAERIKSHEINFNFILEKLSITSTFYYNKQQNILEDEGHRLSQVNVVLDSVWINPDGTGSRVLTQSGNAGSSTAFGTDLFAVYKSEKQSFWASFSYVNFKAIYNKDKLGLSGVSPVNVRLGTTWFPVKTLSVTPSIIFRSTPDNIINIPATLGTDKYIKNPYQINMHINYAPMQWLTVFFNGTNITNHKYALKGVLGPSPQETIRLLAGLRFVFK